MVKNLFYAALMAALLALSFSTGFFYQKSRKLENITITGAEGRDLKAGRPRYGRMFGRCIMDKRIELFDLIKANPPDTALIFDKINEIVEIQREVQKESVDSILVKLNSLEGREREEYIQNLKNNFCTGRGRGEGRGMGRRRRQ